MKKTILILLMLLAVPVALYAKQGVTENYGPVVAEIIERGDAGMADYSSTDGILTGNLFSRLYFDVFETTGMEFTLGLKNNAFMLQIESGFSLVISQSMQGLEKEEVEKSWVNLKKDLLYAVEHYSSGGEETSFWGRVSQSFIILFREGIEAMLVVAALVAYLRRSGYQDKVRVIWIGVALALASSLGAAWVLSALVNASGAGQEAIEGSTMLLASAVLIYVSYWLTAKSDADRWQAFIKETMDKAISKGSLFALGFVAYLAVFREGAETILFYQALVAGSTGQLNAIWIGMALASVGLVIVYLLVRLFFGATAILLYGMAFIFSGNGIMELQVAGMIHTTKLENWPLISWLGVFPTMESMSAQALVIALLPLGWFIMVWKKKKQSAAPLLS